MNGWVKIHRPILEHWLWEDKPFSKGQAWIDILLQCNHSCQKVNIRNEVVTCERGESLNSIKTWAERWGWSRGKVLRFLKLLENDMMIELDVTYKITRLKVLKYDAYQSRRTLNGHKSETPRCVKNLTLADRVEHQTDIKRTSENVYSEKLKNFQNMVEKNYPNVAKMERQITEKELDNLVNRYRPEDIKAVLSDMDNWKPLIKKNISVGRTLENWLRRRYSRSA